MITHRLVLPLLAVALAGPSLASADPLPCVTRAIDWYNSGSNHVVGTNFVALHSNGIAAYLKTTLRPTTFCNTTVTLGKCLVTDAPGNGLVSNSPGSQPFDIHSPLSLGVDRFPDNTTVGARIRSGGTTYDFTGKCQGDLLYGDDQWGNRWTVSFQLLVSPVMH